MKHLLSTFVCSIIFCSISFSQIIYIAPDSSGTGTKTDPAGLEDALTNTIADGVHFRLAEGIYNIDNELVISHHDVYIEGGFIPTLQWAKSSEFGVTTIHRSGLNSTGDSTSTQGIIAINVNQGIEGTILQDLKIIVDEPDVSTYANSGGYGVSTYGIKMHNNNDYRISRVVLEVGNGSDGMDATNGGAGAIGADGENGNSGLVAGYGGNGGSNYGNNIWGGPGGDATLPSDIETLDQSQLDDSFVSNIGTEWQSFTAGSSGLFSRVGLTLEANGEIQFKVYEGEGTGGTLLFETLLGASTTTLNYEEYLIEEPVELTQGMIYTIEVGDNEIWAYDVDNYAGGRSSFDPNSDFAFQTYIMGRAEAGYLGAVPIHYSDGGAGGGGGGQTNNTLLAASGFGGPGTGHASQTSAPGVGLYPYNPAYFLIDGANGINGMDGMDGTIINPSALESFAAGTGTAGSEGQGGMGGAGGAGALDDDTTVSYNGAGGGGGGSGGLGASMSFGGGSSFGIYIYDNGPNGRITSCKIGTSAGGSGGLGATGGPGGAGGAPGNTTGSANPAGIGGFGGDGGTGGSSLDAPDGMNIDVYLVSGEPLLEEESYTFIDTFPIIYAGEAIFRDVAYTVTADTIGSWFDPGSLLYIDSDHINQHITEIYNDVHYNGLIYSGFLLSSQEYQCPSQGPILYVDKNATGTNTGETWTDALTNLQTAIDMSQACANVEEIWVAQGTYYPTRENRFTTGNFETFLLSSDVKIYGGFAGFETQIEERPTDGIFLDPSYRTILSGDLGQNDSDLDGDGLLESVTNPADNAIHVMTLEGVSNQTILDGISITGGIANGPGDGYERRGGAIYMEGSVFQNDPIIRNAVFQTNFSSGNGGAIYIFGNATPMFEYCDFISNTSNFSGGAIATDANSFPNPSYVIEPFYLNCQFKGNASIFNGGAIHNSSWEGGIHISTFAQCLFSGNTSLINETGSCIHNFGLFGSMNVKIINSTIAGNSGNLFNDEYATTEIQNSIIYSNHLNGLELFEGIDNSFYLTHSIIQGHPPSPNIYDIDPEFVDDYAQFNPNEPVPNIEGDYRISNCSPAQDLGDNQLYFGLMLDSLDYAQNPRLKEGHLSDPDLDPVVDLIDLGPWESQGPVYFTATVDSTDAYIDLYWEINSEECNCLEEDPVLKQGVTVQLKSGVNLIDSWVVYEEDYTDENYTFTYRDEVGPDITKDYILEFKKTGPGTLNCRQVERGNTLPFRQITKMTASDNIRPDSIIVSWQNNSTLTNAFNVFRNDSLITTIQADNTLGTEYTFNDVFSFNDGSLVNGETYDYCIETVSAIYENIYNSPLPEQVCDQGSTIGIDFNASDNAFEDKVAMTWNSMAAFADQYRIVRDGISIKSLDPAEVDFDDLMPIYGRESLYGIELLNNNEAFVGSYDFGQVPPNGVVSGVVITSQQKVPVKNVNISLEWQIEDSLYTSNTTTDFSGYFEFDSLYYDESADFTVMADYMDESFEVNPLEINLNLSQSTVDDLVFLMNYDIVDTMQLTIVDTLDVTPYPDKDLVRIEWEFTKTQPSDTIYFNLYRDSELIGQRFNTDETTAPLNMLFDDLNGLPDNAYSYTLYAYRQLQNELIDTSLIQEVIFPPVTPVSLNMVSQDLTNGFLTPEWTHSSTNFNGFRVYRTYQESNLIKNLPVTALEHNDTDGRPGVLTEYFVTSYRTVDGVDYESAPSNIIAETYPALSPVISISIQTLAEEDMIRIEFDLPPIYSSSYAYNGVNIYRTANGTVEKLGSISKNLLTPGVPTSFYDKTGIPGVVYEYEIKPYKLSSGKPFELGGGTASSIFPSVSLPKNLMATSLDGRIRLDWDSPHSSKNINGFEIYKGAGASPDSIGSIPYQFSNTFTDYVTNPPASQSQTYQVATVRYVDGQRYLSTPVSVLADPPIEDGAEAIYLKNLTASKDQSTHIVLCWEW